MRIALIGATTAERAAEIARRVGASHPYPITGFGPHPIPGVQTLPVSTRPSWREWLRLVRFLRRSRYDIIVIPWCYDPGFRRLKLAALLAGGRHYIIFNENFDFSHPSFSFLWRFLRARYREGRLFASSTRFWLLPLKAMAFALRFVTLFVITAYLESNRE